MPRSATGRILQIVLVIAVAVAVLYLLGYLVDYLDNYIPSLAPYKAYLEYAIAGVAAMGGATLIILVVKILLDDYTRTGKAPKNISGVYIVLRVLIYFMALIWFLTFIGVSLENALVGGAIGGIVIGIAVQSVVTSLFSGIMVSTGGLLVPGEFLSLYSYMYGKTITAEVIEVRFLHTVLRNNYGQIVKIPNNALLNYTAYTRLRDRGMNRYNFQATVKNDVPVWVLLEFARKEALNSGKEVGLKELEILLESREETSNVLGITARFEGPGNLNRVVSTINMAIERTYWQIRNAPGEIGKKKDDVEE